MTNNTHTTSIRLKDYSQLKGVPILPCHWDTKAALLPEWEQNSSSEQNTIKEWLKRYSPNCKIGINDPSLFIIDCDINKNTGEKTGEISITRWLGETFIEDNRKNTALSESGGRHIFFKLNDIQQDVLLNYGFGSNANIGIHSAGIGVGESKIDIKGLGIGYVIAYSETPNAIKNAPDMPEELFQALLNDTQLNKSSSIQQNTPTHKQETHSIYAVWGNKDAQDETILRNKALTQIKEWGNVPDGSRHNYIVKHLYFAMKYMFKYQKSSLPQDMLSAMQEAGVKNGYIGSDSRTIQSLEKDIQNTINDKIGNFYYVDAPVYTQQEPINAPQQDPSDCCGKNGGKNVNGTPCMTTTPLIEGRCSKHPRQLDDFRDKVIEDTSNVRNRHEIVSSSIVDTFMENNSIIVANDIVFIEIDALWCPYGVPEADAYIQELMEKRYKDMFGDIVPLKVKDIEDTVKLIKGKIQNNIRKRKIPTKSMDVFQNNKFLLQRVMGSNVDAVEYRKVSITGNIKHTVVDKNDYMLHSTPILFRWTASRAGKSDENSNIARFLNSFPDEVWGAIKKLFAPSTHKGGIMIFGESNAGKTELFNLLKLLFEKNGVAYVNAGSISQSRFNPVSIALSENKICVMDEPDKKKYVDWDSVFEYLGSDYLSVERKGYDALELPRIGNPVFLANNPPPKFYISSRAMRNRFPVGNIVLIGTPDFEELKNKYSKRNFGKQKVAVEPHEFNSYCDAEMAAASNRSTYTPPFNISNDEEWDVIKNDMRTQKSLRYLYEFVMEKFNKTYVITEKNKLDHDLFCNLVDFSTLASTKENFRPHALNEMYEYEPTMGDEMEERKDAAIKEMQQRLPQQQSMVPDAYKDGPPPPQDTEPTEPKKQVYRRDKKKEDTITFKDVADII